MPSVKNRPLCAFLLWGSALLILIACRSGETFAPSPTVTPTATSTPTLIPMPAASATLDPILSPTPASTAPATEADVIIDFEAVVGLSPTGYGTNGWWNDEDAELWRARYAELGPQVVRLPALQMILEPLNDNDDPGAINWAGFRFGDPFPLPIGGEGRRVTYRLWFETLRDLDITLLLHTPYLSGWLSANGNRDPFSSFPPTDVAEYGEFVRALLTYLVDEVGYPPQRIILEPVNEADLRCGADPAVPCFWQDWEMDDLFAVVRTAHEQAAAVDPAIRIAGLATCCDTNLLPRFMVEYKGDEYLDVITYHRYGRGFDFGSAIARGVELQAYGKPVYLDEFGSTKYWSNGLEGALWHSAVMPQIWAAGINPVQFSISEWPGMHQGYNQLGLFADWTGDWARKPAYWVYVNFYAHLNGAELVRATSSPDLFVLAGRHLETETLAVWLTNVTLARKEKLAFQIDHWPTNHAILTAYDNLSGPQSIDTISVAVKGGQLLFDYAVPEHSSFSLVLQAIP